MQTVACPNCGAELSFRSSASVMAVCGYCRTTVLKDADAVRQIGQMSEALEDYSPIQIMTNGLYQGRPFTVVGRIQLRYSDGIWNEWHIMFDDGASGWLSDAQGQYVVTEQSADLDAQSPGFETIKPGDAVKLSGAVFYASDVRTARCVGGEGELPFVVGAGWEAKAVDLRSLQRFATLDYSDPGVPRLYLGQALPLSRLQCQNLRSRSDVEAESQRYQGKAVPFECPSCGSSVSYRAGMAYHVVCSSCHAEIDCSTDKALVLQKAQELETKHTTIALGDKAKINGIEFEAIGLMQRQCSIDGSTYAWIEYLLFSVDGGFVWLVESSDGWSKSLVLNEWPTPVSDTKLVVDGIECDLKEQYVAQVLYAIGSFNWRVSIGDRVLVREYTKHARSIVSESNDNEVVWSQGQKLDAKTVLGWFGRASEVGADASLDASGSSAMSFKNNVLLAIIVSAVLVCVHIPILVSTNEEFEVVFYSLCLLWLPIYIMRKFNSGDSD